jgi:DNA-binding transcriptional regulator YhcF (GntR family)
MGKRIDLSASASLVEQMVEILITDLMSASPGSKILPERALAEKYDVSRKTVREAILRLTEQGYFTRCVGRGTFLSDKVLENDKERVNQFIYSDYFPSNVMDEVSKTLNDSGTPTVSPSYFQGSHKVFDLYFESVLRGVCLPEGMDIITLDEDLLPLFVENRILSPLNDLLEESSSLASDFFHPAVLEAFSYQGNLYGIPQTFTLPVLFYNKKLFRDHGIDEPSDWLWSDLARAASELTTVDHETGVDKTFGMGFFQTNVNMLLPFLYQNFSPNIDLSQIELFKRPEALEALKFTYDMVFKERICSSFQNSITITPAEMFADERTAMFIGTYRDYLEMKCDFEWGMAELPGQKRKFTSLPVQGWGITASSTRKNEAFAVLERLSEECVSSEIARKTKRIPACRGYKNKDIPDVFIDSLEFARKANISLSTMIEQRTNFQREICLLFNKFSSPEIFSEKMTNKEI